MLLAQPTIASKEWVYEQYDYMVQTNTVVSPGSDAAVLRIRDSKKALAMTTDRKNSLFKKWKLFRSKLLYEIS